METDDAVKTIEISISARARAAAMIVGLVVGMAALVTAIIMLEDGGSTTEGRTTEDGGSLDEEQPTGAAESSTQVPAVDAESGWPPSVEFRPSALGDPGSTPTLDPQAQPALYLWSDFEGWHLWAVGSGGGSITGSVVIDAAFGPVATEVGSAVASEPVDGRFEFQMGANEVSGVVFNPGFFTKRIEIRVDGDAVPAVLIGRDEVSTALPVAIAMDEPIRTLEN